MTDERPQPEPEEWWPPLEETHAEPGQEVLRRGRWTCRLHVWHRWRTHRYPTHDGGNGTLYQECLDCGKQRDVGSTRGFVQYRDDV